MEIALHILGCFALGMAAAIYFIVGGLIYFTAFNDTDCKHPWWFRLLLVVGWPLFLGFCAILAASFAPPKGK